MKAPKELTSPIVSIKGFKTKDGRDPIAEKTEEARKFLEKHPLPDFITKRQPQPDARHE